jgi:hypothetical protein
VPLATGPERKETETMEAYVLVQTDTGRQIADAVRAVPGVVFADDVSGPYDALALARYDGEGFDGVLAQIRALPGVIHALAAPLARPLVLVGSDAA